MRMAHGLEDAQREAEERLASTVAHYKTKQRSKRLRLLGVLLLAVGAITMGAGYFTRPENIEDLPVAIEVGGNEGAGAGANAEGEDKSGKTNRLMIAGAIVFGVGVVLEAVASSKD